LNQLLRERPDEFISIQIHSGHTSWGNQRSSFYNVTGIPVTWFDGVIQRLGASSDQQAYSSYSSAINSRLNVATDVTIDISAVETATQTYDVTATVGIEAGGTGKSMTVILLQVLDYYPTSSDYRYRNCVRQHLGTQTVTLAAGETADVSFTCTLSGLDWTDRRNVKIIAMAQQPGSPAPKQIYQANYIAWPIAVVPGDVNGDGDVDLGDLAELLAAYGTCDGDAGYDQDADFDDSGCIDLSDLATLLSNYGTGN